MEGLDAAGDSGVPGHRCQQGPADIHDGEGARVLVPVPDRIWSLLLHVEDRGHGPREILQGYLQTELPDRGPLSDHEQTVSVLQLHTACVVLVHLGEFSYSLYIF